MLNWRGMWFGARRMMHRHGPIAMIARAGVELSDEQVEKLAEIKGEGFFKFAEHGVGMIPQVREFVQHLSKSQIDKDKVRAIHKEIQAKRNQMGDQFVENIMAIAEVLTPEQRKQVRMYMLRQSLGLGADEHECDGPQQGGPPPSPRMRHRQ